MLLNARVSTKRSVLFHISCIKIVKYPKIIKTKDGTGGDVLITENIKEYRKLFCIVLLTDAFFHTKKSDSNSHS